MSKRRRSGSKPKPLRDTKLLFNEAEHRYTIRGGKQLESVTAWLKKYNPPFKPFDEALQAEKYAQKYNMQVEDVLKLWEGNRNFGTAVHKEIEDYLLGMAVPESDYAKHALSMLPVLVTTEDRVFPELRICSKPLSLAGTIDLCVEHPDKSITIVDWKTNKTLYGDASSLGVNHYTQLPDHTLIKYFLQVSAYAYILKTAYNRTVKIAHIVHLTPEGAVAHSIVPQIHYIEQMIEAKQ